MAEQTHQQHIVNADSIYINNKNDRQNEHIQIGTAGVLGDNDLVLNNCNVDIISGGYVKAPEIRTAVIKDTAGNTTITLTDSAIDFHSKTINNFTFSSGSISASSVSSANGYASLDAELDALTTNKVSITGHTASKIFVSSSGGGLTTGTINPADVTSAISKLSGIEASADVTDTANVTSAGALMDSEMTDLAGVKGVTISTLQVKPSEGAFVNGDKTKLNAIEASADVTDTANVTSAGALMDSEMTDLAGVKGVTISTLQVKPSEGAFVNGDKTKLDSAVQYESVAGDLFVGGGVGTYGSDFKFRGNGLVGGVTIYHALMKLPSVLGADITLTLPGSTCSLQPVNGSGTIISDDERTKLSNIETSADVTDATNVASAGAFMASGVSAFGATLIDDANASTARTTLGLGTASTTASGAYATAAQGTLATNAIPQSAISSLGSDWIGLTSEADMRSTLGLGTAATSNTSAFATSAQGTLATNALPASGVSAFGATLIDDANASTARTTLGLGTASTTASTAYAVASTTTTANANATKLTAQSYASSNTTFTGYVGVGATPSYRLYAEGGTENGGQVAKFSTTTNTWIETESGRGTAGVQGWGIANYGDGNLYFYKRAGNIGTTGFKMAITSTGRVGIGTTAPGYPLEVLGSVNYTFGSGSWQYTGIGNASWTGSRPIGIKSLYAIWTNYSLLVSSDRRIKKNIRDIDDGLALKQLRALEPKYYDYIDPKKNSETSTIGFIAQDVLSIIPNAVSIQPEIIPNEMRDLENLNWETITDENGNETFKLTISDLEDVSGNTKYRFYCSNEDLIEKQIEISSLENEPKSFIFEEKWDKIFLYGKEVDDFHIIDKNKIFAIAFSATQEIDRIQQQHAIEIATLKQQLSNIENRLTAGNL